MALLVNYEIGGSLHQDAYVRVEHISGSKAGGWQGVVYVFNEDKTMILDTFNVDTLYDSLDRGYTSIYKAVMEMFPTAVSV